MKYYNFKNNEKKAAIFLLTLLISLLCIKILFFIYNQPALGNSFEISSHNFFKLVKWSFLNDMLVLLIINTPLFICLAILSFFQKRKIAVIAVSAVFVFINFTCLALNIMDVFYFHFHRQRADADLLYVLQHPFQKTWVQNPFATLAAIVAGIGLMYFLIRQHKKLLAQFKEGKHFIITATVMFICSALCFVGGTKNIIPTNALRELNSAELQLVQNSFHTFLYSVYRQKEGIVHPYDYMPAQTAYKIISVKKPGCSPLPGTQKNIVLFIMESIPEDFFNASSRHKVRMSFLDSLVNQSTYFSNAYSYGRNSNTGITSILAGIPTLTEIPLYHSNYASLQISPVGKLLTGQGYSSSFFISDNYDDFGFAKFSNWVGIQNYFSKEDIPGYKKLESNTMGLHDKHSLEFMAGKINQMQAPFFAVNYNTSTHFPNDLPASYKEKFPKENFSGSMKTMNYYNECLQEFFKNAVKQDWYGNTIFIFCSDHWMYPDTRYLKSDIVQSFHIPIFIFDPSLPQKLVHDMPVSQLDILPTILCIAGVRDSAVSYGVNLRNENFHPNRVLFSKENSNLYQAMDSSHVLGFNIITGQAEFCYNYKTDLNRNRNLVKSNNAIVDSLTIKMKAFLQTASWHYNKKIVF